MTSFFFFKQKTAYELRISDWSSDVCSSDLQRPLGQRAMVTRHPVGPVAGFSPWNFPVNLMVKKIAPALAAGCVVIAKAPEETPGCTSAVMRCIADAGIAGDRKSTRLNSSH